MATTSEVQFTFSTIAEEQIGKDSVAFLEHHGYQVVFGQPGHWCCTVMTRRRGKGSHEEAAR